MRAVRSMLCTNETKRKIDAIFVQCLESEWAEERREAASLIISKSRVLDGWEALKRITCWWGTNREHPRHDDDRRSSAPNVFFFFLQPFYVFAARRKEFAVDTKTYSAQVTISILHFRFRSKLNTHRKGRNGVELVAVRLIWSNRNWVEADRLIDIEKFYVNTCVQLL